VQAGVTARTAEYGNVQFVGARPSRAWRGLSMPEQAIGLDGPAKIDHNFRLAGRLFTRGRGPQQYLSIGESSMALSSFRIATAFWGVSLAAVSLGPIAAGAQEPAPPFAKINHFLVIYTENRSLDGLYGQFPGADNFGSKQDFPPQIDFDGTALKTLPRARIRDKVDDRFPADLANVPFAIDQYVSAKEKTGDLVHKFYQEQEQINGGRNDRFAAISDAGGLVMGYYKGDTQQLWTIAKDFTLADHFHHAAFGSSFLNHFWLVCACTPVFPSPLAKMVAAVDPKTGFLARASDSPKSALDGPPKWVSDGAVTPDGFAVNTIQPTYPPFSSQSLAPERLPPQTMPTIGERLSEKKISWAWYSGGWNQAVLGKIESYEGPDYFQPHHQPFNYFAAYAPGTRARAEHLQDLEDLKAAIASGNLPAVASRPATRTWPSSFGLSSRAPIGKIRRSS
jgi:acid phosphatase